ncbi:Anti-sigma-E factor ChrR [Candidatus Terasakiella magnetica]|uniref:Anti-sigma-E factor ChrR n=1 Tax=Candidatus Terasakiella magnetica TaxID=1867952 RepID=A0A1C3RH17_9PROT|nr:ChrR family anti-sigma-E factor [Candidatus Terasakiella magnetica]SCA56550.1 Anti-sigma-E factor ChrR [Candidatus Terasakiella magnetica]
MTIYHHLNDETLMAYAAGSVSESMSFVIATHLSLCPNCRNKVIEMESLGGVALEDETQLAMQSGALDTVLGMLDDDFSKEKLTPANDQNKSDIPMPLAQYIPSELNEIKWKNMAPGIKTFPLTEVKAGSGSVRLLKISPGVTIPEHSHSGSELTLVLKGSFSDEIGRFKAGDIADLDDDTNHQPIADSSEDCICLVVTEGPLQFKALVPRLMQYFVGM